jgi:rubrerythrin
MSIASDLRQSIKEEIRAKNNYLRRARTADPATAKLYRHIANEEIVHAHEFNNRLKVVSRR